MTFYSDMQQVAQDLLNEFGGSVTYVQRTKGAYTSASGQTWTESSTTKPAVLTNYKRMGTQVVEGLYALIAENEFAFSPDLDDYVTVNGVDYEIAKIEPINPGTVNLLYRFKLVKGSE